MNFNKQLAAVYGLDTSDMFTIAEMVALKRREVLKVQRGAVTVWYDSGFRIYFEVGKYCRTSFRALAREAIDCANGILGRSKLGSTGPFTVYELAAIKGTFDEVRHGSVRGAWCSLCNRWSIRSAGDINYHDTERWLLDEAVEYANEVFRSSTNEL